MKDPFSASGAFLIPFVGRIPNGTYIFDGKRYDLRNDVKEGEVKHGLLYNRSWTLSKVEESKSYGMLEFNYTLDPNEFSGYPFELSACARVVLRPDGLEVLSLVKNIGENKLPLAFGWHPYLTLSESTINDYFLKVPAEKVVVLDESKTPTGEKMDVSLCAYDFRSFRKIGQLEMDVVYIDLVYSDDRVYTTLYDDKSNFGVALWQDRKYRFIVIYTPPHRRSIAIEPWTSAPNCFNKPVLGLIVLPPQEKIEAKFGVMKIYGMDEIKIS